MSLYHDLKGRQGFYMQMSYEPSSATSIFCMPLNAEEKTALMEVIRCALAWREHMDSPEDVYKEGESGRDYVYGEAFDLYEALDAFVDAD